MDTRDMENWYNNSYRKTRGLGYKASCCWTMADFLEETADMKEFIEGHYTLNRWEEATVAEYFEKNDQQSEYVDDFRDWLSDLAKTVKEIRETATTESSWWKVVEHDGITYVFELCDET